MFLSKARGKKNVLCIVDVQTGFVSHEYARDGVKEEIDNAIQRGWTIVVLEYVGYGRTDKGIRDKMANYDKVFYALKNDDNGADELITILSHLGVGSPREVRFCGVNTCCCVRDTAYNYGRKVRNYPKVPVISFSKEGTACCCDSGAKCKQYLGRSIEESLRRE